MTANPNRPMTSGEWAMLLVLSVLWGGSFLFAKVAVAEVPPFTVVLVRVALAAAALWLALRVTGHRLPRDRGVWAAFYGMALLNNVIPFGLFFWGVTQIGSGLAAILNATTPLFGAIAAHVLTRDEKITPNRMAGILAGLCGVAVMVGPAALEGVDAGVVAQLACLGGALSYGFAGVFGRRFRGMGIPPMVTAAGQVTASVTVTLPLAMLIDRPWTLPMPSVEVMGALIGLALASTALAYILFFRILATAGTTNLLLVTFLVPVSGLLLGMSLLGEELEARQVAGMSLIGVGLACVDGRPLRRLRRMVRPGSRTA
ncbi:MAG TPA: DMT family transporter [Azospirillaceae bacterium]|nr:DMT family transporter [Azospirillaceae bacterium]